MYYHGTRVRFKDLRTPCWFCADFGMALIYALDDDAWAPIPDSKSRVIVAVLSLANPFDLRSISLDDYLSFDEFSVKTGLDCHCSYPLLAKKHPAHDYANDPALIGFLRQKGFEGYLALECDPRNSKAQIETCCVFDPTLIEVRRILKTPEQIREYRTSLGN